jgi:hypothetical protein
MILKIRRKQKAESREQTAGSREQGQELIK